MAKSVVLKLDRNRCDQWFRWGRGGGGEKNQAPPPPFFLFPSIISKSIVLRTLPFGMLHPLVEKKNHINFGKCKSKGRSLGGGGEGTLLEKMVRNETLNGAKRNLKWWLQNLGCFARWCFASPLKVND